MKTTIISVIIILMLAATASAVQEIDNGAFSSEQCFVNGQVKLPIQINIEKGRASFDDLEIEACVVDSDRCFEVTGVFYDRDETEIVPSGAPDDQLYFISDEELFKMNTEYEIRFSNIPGAEDEDDYFDFSVTCPGFMYTCSQLNPTINECFVWHDKFFATFTGIRDERIDIYDDLEYQIDWKLLQRRPVFYEPPAGFKVTSIGNDKYMLTFDLTDQMATNGIDSLRIAEKHCNSKVYKTEAYKTCVRAPKVFCGNEACDTGETCESCSIDCCKDKETAPNPEPEPTTETDEGEEEPVEAPPDETKTNGGLSLTNIALGVLIGIIAIVIIRSVFKRVKKTETKKE